MYGDTMQELAERYAKDLKRIDAEEAEEVRSDLCRQIQKVADKAVAAALKWHRPRVKGISRMGHSVGSRILIGIQSPPIDITLDFDALSWADRPEEEMVDYVTKMSNIIIGHLRAFRALDKRRTPRPSGAEIPVT